MVTSTVASSGSSPPPRRSGREHKSTTLQVQGYTILKKNNYVVNGFDYVHGSHEPDDEENQKKKKKKKKTVSTTTTKTRKQTESEMERMKHNEKIKIKIKSKQSLQESFLSCHLDILNPCIEEKTKHTLEQLYNYHHPSQQQQKQKKNKNSTTTTTTTTTKIPLYKHETILEQPKSIRATLRDYQMIGLNFLMKMHKQNISMILGDEMGLGKTLQTLTFLVHLKENENITGPSLVVCPLSVLTSWCSEIEKWAPHLKYFRLHANSSEEQDSQKHILQLKAHEYDIIVTTYEMAKLSTLQYLYSRLYFNYLILDEGHKIKNHETQIAQAVRKIHCENKLILTGTPLQNNLVELWSLLNFLCPLIFTTNEPFELAFNLSENRINKQFLIQSQKVLELFMLRRLKVEVEKLMPKKIETKVYCPLSKTQIFWYKSLLMKDISELAKMEDSAVSRGKHTLLKSLFMQLRKCCNHPFVFDGTEIDPNKTTLNELVAASGKLAVLDALLMSLCEKGHRSVLFSQFTSMLDIIEDYCNLRGWNYCRLDGNTSRAKRNYLIKQFNVPNSPYFLFLMSTRSGGMGLNLQTADTCILFDSDWNPQSDLQAMGRVHRIGQTKTVHVYRLVSSGTIEERMLERAEKKLLLEVVNRESNALSMNTNECGGLSGKELLDDIKFGSEAIFGENSKNELPTQEDINLITDRKRLESDSVGKLHGAATKSASTFDAEKEFSASQTFGGVDFRAIRMEEERKATENVPKSLRGIGNLWKEISVLSKKRKAKSRLLYVEGKGSGYGLASVPVLASNNYELEKGESSVFARELSHNNKEKFAVPEKKKRKINNFEHQDICQACLDGGTMVLCPRCPVSMHLKCCGLRSTKQFDKCPHHHCTMCMKNRSRAGGLLFPCHACTVSYCEDCLPAEGITILGQCDRFEELGFDSTKNVVYINCSESCAEYAKQHFHWKPPREDSRRQKCPEPIDVSDGFVQQKSVNELVASNMSMSRTSKKIVKAQATVVSQTKTSTTMIKGTPVKSNKVKVKLGSNAMSPIVLNDESNDDDDDESTPKICKSVKGKAGSNAKSAIMINDDDDDTSSTPIGSNSSSPIIVTDGSEEEEERKMKLSGIATI